MNCKDCVHYDACQEMYDLLTSLDDIDFLDNQYAQQDCLLFKNKANCVELPCELGSEIYILVTRHTKSFTFEGNRKMVMRENQHTIIKKTTFTKSNFFSVIEQFGKTVFLTKEEAEQKLKGGMQE